MCVCVYENFVSSRLPHAFFERTLGILLRVKTPHQANVAVGVKVKRTLVTTALPEAEGWAGNGRPTR